MTKRKSKKADSYSGNTSSGNNALLIYLREINRIPLLTKQEEEKAARLASRGNTAARERLINANLRFVVSVAKKYQGKGLSLEDLISEGNVGLLNSVDHFDVEKGYRFITYAVWWIRQAIIKAIHEKGRMIRLPCNKINELSKMEKVRTVIENNNSGRGEQNIQEIATYMDVPQEKAADLLKISQDVLYLDDQTSGSYDSQVIRDSIEDDFSKTPVDCAINSALRDELEKLINRLEERDADVIRSRYGLGDSCPQTLKEIGVVHNLSKERVRQIEKRILGQLQKSPNRKRLKSYIA